MVHLTDEVRNALLNDQLIGIITTGVKTGFPRKTEIWFVNIKGRITICGTPNAVGKGDPRNRRDWLANLKTDPDFFILPETVNQTSFTSKSCS
jgi:hypothetical protein